MLGYRPETKEALDEKNSIICVLLSNMNILVLKTGWATTP